MSSDNAPAIHISNLWHFFNGPNGWRPPHGASAEEVLASVEPIRPQNSFLLHVPHLEIARGSFVCLVGPSGCGKTTLLTVMGLLRKPTHVDLFTLSVPEVSAEPLVIQNAKRAVPSDIREVVRRHHIGFALQSGELLGALTAAENVSLPLHATGQLRDVAKRGKALEYEKNLFHSLFDPADERPTWSNGTNGEELVDRIRGSRRSALSGGQRQRVLLARSIVHNPTLVFADEPTNNLDQQSAFAAVRALLAMRDSLESQSTIVMVTHDEELARHFGLPILRLRSFEDRQWLGTVDYERTSRSTAVIIRDSQSIEERKSVWADELSSDGNSQLDRSSLLGRFGMYTKVAIKDGYHDRNLVTSFILTVLCLTLPLLLLFGLRNGLIQRLTQNIRQSPTLSRLRITPWRESTALNGTLCEQLKSEFPAIRAISLGRSINGKLRFRTPGDVDPIPALDSEFLNGQSEESEWFRGFLKREGDVEADNYQIYLLDERDPLIDTLGLRPLTGRALEIVVYREHAEKLLRYAVESRHVPANATLSAGYLELGVHNGGEFHWVPVRILDLITSDPRYQTAYVPLRLLEKLEIFRQGFPVDITDDSGIRGGLSAPTEFHLPGTENRYGDVEYAYESILLYSQRSPDEPLLDLEAAQLLESYELECVEIASDDPRATFFGYLDRPRMTGADAPKFPSYARCAAVVSRLRDDSGQRRPVVLTDGARRSLWRRLREGSGRNENEQAFCLGFNPPIDVSIGGSSFRAISLPQELRGRLPYYVHTKSRAREAKQPRFLDGISDLFARPVAKTLLPMVALMPPDDSHPLPVPSELSLAFEEGVEVRVADDVTYEVAVGRRPVDLDDLDNPLRDWVYLPEDLVALHRAQEIGTVVFDRATGKFHPALRGNLEFTTAFVYPKDIEDIPVLRQVLAADFEVHAPGVFAVKELQGNAAILERLVSIIYWATFLAAIVTIFIVTVMNVFQRMPMIGVLRLVGLTPAAVLWVITVRNFFLMAIGSALVISGGYLVQAGINALVSPGTCWIEFSDCLKALAMVCASCVFAFCYSGLKAARFEPVKLIEQAA